VPGTPRSSVVESSAPTTSVCERPRTSSAATAETYAADDDVPDRNV
jgi:hypothetical protein